MSKLCVLIFYLTFVLFSCEKQKTGKNDRVANPSPTPVERTEKNNKVASNAVKTNVNWSGLPRFGCVDALDRNNFRAIVADNGKLLSTEDGGANWNTIKENNVGCIDFIDANNGWLFDVEKNNLSVTADDKIWTEKTGEFPAGSVKKLKFTDSANGWLMDSTGVFHTSDGGNSWTESLVAGENLRGQPNDLFFLDNQTGWVCDGGDVSGNVHKTETSGAKWSSRKVSENGNSPCRIFFVNASKGFYSLQNQLFETKNGGNDWNAVKSLPGKFEIRSMFWQDAENGWLAGFFETKPRQPQNGKAAVLNTTDGGKTWTEKTIDVNVPFFTEIIFTDSQNGWLVSRDGIYKTSDGGANWKQTYRLSEIEKMN